jgi:hypothetical protein
MNEARVGSTVSTIRGMFSTRPSTRADDLHAISTRHGIDGAILWACGVLTVSYRGRLLRRSAARSARALNAWPTTASVHGEYRSSLASRACVLPRQPGPPARRKVAPVAGVRVVTLCKLIDLVSRSTLYRSYQISLASTLAESNVLGISVYNQRPARNFKPYDSTP